MSTIRYFPSSLANALDGFLINKIFICAYPATGVSAPATSGSPKTNHWILFCTTSDGNSIRIDLTPAGPDLSIVLIVTRNQDPHTAYAIKAMELQISSLTAKQFIDLLEHNKYDKYQFSPGGQGCRYWLYRVVELLQQQNHITTQPEAQNTLDALELVWATNGAPVPASEQSPITKGRFYAL